MTAGASQDARYAVAAVRPLSATTADAGPSSTAPADRGGKTERELHLSSGGTATLFQGERSRLHPAIDFTPGLVNMKLLVQDPNGYITPNVSETRRRQVSARVEPTPASAGLCRALQERISTPADEGPHERLGWTRAKTQPGKTTRISGARLYSPDGAPYFARIHGEPTENLPVRHMVTFGSTSLGDAPGTAAAAVAADSAASRHQSNEEKKQ